jgi:CubicO group peptidase (beta-lactamase class C family)
MILLLLLCSSCRVRFVMWLRTLIPLFFAGCMSNSGLNALPTAPVDDPSTPPVGDPDDEPTVTPTPPPVPAECANFAARFEAARASVQNQLTAAGIPGASFAASCGGQVLSAGIGVVRAGGAPVAPSTRFQVASVSKALTATAALELDAAGVLDLHAPISTWMPTLVYGDEVTLHDLLTHTSGLETSFPNWEPGLTASALANPNLARWAPPGEVWNYNNYGYAVAGAVMEAASGQPFDALMDERVFGPLGMGRATTRTNQVTAGDYAYGHADTASNPRVLGPQDSYYNDDWYGPMGGAWATAEDLVRFGSALGSRSTLGAQWTAQTRTGETATQQYGYGLFIEPGTSPAIVHHGGSVEGFTTMFEAVPQAGVAVALVVNADWDLPQVGLLDQLVDLGPGTSGPSAAASSRLVGVYDSDVFGEIEVRAQGGTLMMDFPDGSSSPMSAWNYNSYDVEWSGEAWGPIWVTAWDDGQGPVEYLVSPWGIAHRR